MAAKNKIKAYGRIKKWVLQVMVTENKWNKLVHCSYVSQIVAKRGTRIETTFAWS